MYEPLISIFEQIINLTQVTKCLFVSNSHKGIRKKVEKGFFSPNNNSDTLSGGFLFPARVSREREQVKWEEN